MLRYLWAAGLVAAAGAMTSAIAFADSGFAASNDLNSVENTIVIDPYLLTDHDQHGVDEQISAQSEERLAIISEPAIHASVPADISNSQTFEVASLRDLVAAQPHRTSLDSEMQCLAGTVYFESKGESLDGQLAVAEVVLARRDSRRWPNSICGVVYQKSQFSFVRNGNMPRINKASSAWRNAVAIANIATEKRWDSPVKGSYFFHARYVSPGWRLQRVGSVDNHIFYR